MTTEGTTGTFATTSLAKLRLPRRGLTRTLASLFVRYRVARRAEAGEAATYRVSARPTESGQLAVPEVARAAERLGLRYLGVSEFLGLVGFIPRDVWVSECGRVLVSARRATAGGVEGQMSPYIVSSVLDDRTALETYGKSPAPIPSSENVLVLGGRGDLEADVALHLTMLKEQMDAHPEASPVVIHTIDEAVALWNVWDVDIGSLACAEQIVTVRLTAYGAVIGLVFALVWALTHVR